MKNEPQRAHITNTILTHTNNSTVNKRWINKRARRIRRAACVGPVFTVPNHRTPSYPTTDSIPPSKVGEALNRPFHVNAEQSAETHTVPLVVMVLPLQDVHKTKNRILEMGKM